MPDHVRKMGGGEHWSVLHAPFLLYVSSEETFRFYRPAPSLFLPSMPRYLALGPPDELGKHTHNQIEHTLGNVIC